MKVKLLGLAGVILLLAVASCTGPAASSTQTITTFFSQTSASITAVNGLKLSISINATQIASGNSISIMIDETNTFNSINTVAAADLWAIPKLTLGGCGTLNYPFGIAIGKGFYDASSVSTLSSLTTLYDPTKEYPCPFIIPAISYTWNPLSNQATANTANTGVEFLQVVTNDTVSASGYWGGSPVVFTNFAPGVYTIVGGDEWGALVLLHFTVN
jgi:hypothetical protein